MPFNYGIGLVNQTSKVSESLQKGQELFPSADDRGQASGVDRVGWPFKSQML